MNLEYWAQIQNRNLTQETTIQSKNTKLKSTFTKFVELISELPDDSQLVGLLNKLIQKNLPSDLAFIQTYLSFLFEKITKLETQRLFLHDQAQVMEMYIEKFKSFHGLKDTYYSKKKKIIKKKITPTTVQICRLENIEPSFL